MFRSLIALAVLSAIATSAEARRTHHPQTPTQHFNGDRYAGGGMAQDVLKAVKVRRDRANRSVRQASQARRQRAPQANPLIYQDRPQAVARRLQGTPPALVHPKLARFQARAGKRRLNPGNNPVITGLLTPHSFIAGAADALIEPARQVVAAVTGGRPAGCPHRFCGCALSIKVFGQSVRGLWLASNWFRFRRVAAAPGMVAVRRGHVFQLLAHVGGTKWRVYDPNSGGGRIRIHDRSIAGYTIVDPHGSRQTLSSDAEADRTHRLSQLEPRSPG